MYKLVEILNIGIVMLFLPPTSSRPQQGDLWKQVPGLVECVPRPRPYKIADSQQCDKYYVCDNGVASPHLCEDGTVFHFPIQSCILLNGADCDGRPNLQNSENKTKCPRKNGLFPHEDASQCDKYYQCLDGHPTLITCPDMLLFDRVRGVCNYADLANTSNCRLPPSPVVCPSENETSSLQWDLKSRLLPHPTDCGRFFFCETIIPRPLACEPHLAFDLETLSCIDKALVPRCQKLQ